MELLRVSLDERTRQKIRLLLVVSLERIEKIEPTPRIAINTAITTKVQGSFNAIRTKLKLSRPRVLCAVRLSESLGRLG
jgi:hypothetical protein